MKALDKSLSDKLFCPVSATLMRIALNQTLPPLLLLPLVMTPFDERGMVLWMVGVLAALISILPLLKRMACRGAGERIFRWETMTRPLLTVLIVSGAFGVGLMVQADTERYAQGLAAELQRECKEQARCPAKPDGWQLDERNAQGDQRRAQATHGHWHFTYVTNPERSEFELWIRKAAEVEVCIHGGSAIMLGERDSLFCASDSKL